MAIKTCPPGRKAWTTTLAHSTKKRRRESRSLRSRAVNLGRGARVLPSNEGGILQIPPLPFDLFSDPPYGVKEYEFDQMENSSNGNGCIWRVPPSFVGSKRSPLPRFTAVDRKERDAL